MGSRGEDERRSMMTPAELEQLAPYLAKVMAPEEHTVQEIAPGVFAHTWRWHSETDEESGGDGQQR